MRLRMQRGAVVSDSSMDDLVGLIQDDLVFFEFVDHFMHSLNSVTLLENKLLLIFNVMIELLEQIMLGLSKKMFNHIL